jgi:hypothetical protein
MSALGTRHIFKKITVPFGKSAGIIETVEALISNCDS